ncbi:AMP-binding protein [Streptomyces sp. NPDC051940]|uniref:AMP-binding protein n=1 Tax=Streptomyces sp. NPDC051940 TaxID=3155675 RepID=UPI00341E0328
MLVDARSGAALCGAGLDGAVDAAAAELAARPPGLLVLFARRDLVSVLRYLAALRTSRPVLLADPEQSPAAVAELVRCHEPALALGPPDGIGTPAGYERDGDGWTRRTPMPHRPHPDLAVLLATSGTTGSPRLVRLSGRGLRANALGITEALHIGPDEVSLTGLPLFYGYGLAVLNTHLLAGATLVVTPDSPVSAGFWRDTDRYRATAFGAVPATYEMLTRLHWDPLAHPALRSLTQAGGRLRPPLARELGGRMRGAGRTGLYVMYGQTEATARMSVLPADRLDELAGSVGAALPGTRFTIDSNDQVVFHGPNVMMGYAHTAADLARGDDLGGVLGTGDRGRLDDEGHLFLTGRNSRLGKVRGIRVDLDSVEQLMAALDPALRCAVAAVCDGERLTVWCEADVAAADWAALSARLSERLRLSPRSCAVRPLSPLPLLATGKVDYRALEAT